MKCSAAPRRESWASAATATVHTTAEMPSPMTCRIRTRAALWMRVAVAVVVPMAPLLRSVRLQVLGEGLATDLLALEDARHGGVAEVNPRVHAGVAILLLGLAQALERPRNTSERRPARHGEAQLIGAEEARHHHRCRPAQHAVRGRIVREGGRVHERLPDRI